MAVQRDRKNENGTYDADFIPVVAWRQTADYVSRYMHKGSKVAVEGRIQTRTYDAKDGTKRYVTEIQADHVEGLDRRGDGNTQTAKPVQAQAPAANSFDEVDPGDDLPF